MIDGQSAFAEPMTMEEALAKADSLMDQAKEAPAQETAQEPEQEANAEPEAAEEAEADVATDETEEQPDAEEPTDEESEQILTVEEYGDVLIDMDGTPTPLKDVIQGTLMQADYTRKTMSHSEKVKADEAALKEREKQLDARQQQLEQMAAEIEEQEPDWEALAEEDPLGWPKEKAIWDKKQAARQKQKADAEARQAERIQEIRAMSAEKAIGVFPEWGDLEKFKSGIEARRDAALSAGFTVEEYNTTPDLRVAVLLEKAARYDAMQADQGKKRVAAEKKIARSKKVLKPGASPGVSDPQAERRAARQKQLSKPISNDALMTMIGR